MHGVFPLTVGFGLQWVEMIFFYFFYSDLHALRCLLDSFPRFNFQKHTVPILSFCFFFYYCFLPPLWVSHFLSGPLPVARNKSITALWKHCLLLCFICFCLEKKATEVDEIMITHTQDHESCRTSLFSIYLRLKVIWGPVVVSKWISVQQAQENFHSVINCFAIIKLSFSSTFQLSRSSCSAPPSCLFQLQLLHSSIRVWEGAPDCSCVRVAQDVTAEPASADQCRSLWQREPGWLLPEPQQQLHQHQERDTVRLAIGANTLALFF